MKKNKFKKNQELDLNNNWAKVELWTWQYDKLPSNDDDRPLDIPVALNAMANALLNNKTKPQLYSVAAVLRYIAYLLDKKVK